MADTLLDNRYRLIEMKGSGAFGEVWLARDEELDLDVAVKVYIVLDEHGIEEFKSEFKTTYTLNHPNLLHAYHFGVSERRPYLVMPYCPTSATSMIGQLDEKTVWQFIYDVAGGLAYLHDRDIIHRDIKPDNVLRNSEGMFQITDFGVSVKMRTTLRKNSLRQMADSKEIGGGSPSYMAPELFSATPDAVKATDIWALGATLYEIVTGDLPFYGQGGGMQLRGAELPEMNADVSQELKNLITACLQKETWDRPTAQQLYDYAKAQIDGRQSPPSRKKFRSKVRRSKERDRIGFREFMKIIGDNVPTVYLCIIAIGSLFLSVFFTVLAGHNVWNRNYDALDLDTEYSLLAKTEKGYLINITKTGSALTIGDINQLDRTYGASNWIIEPGSVPKQPRHNKMIIYAIAAFSEIMIFAGCLLLWRKSKLGFWLITSVQIAGTVCLCFLLWTNVETWIIRGILIFALLVGVPLLNKILTLPFNSVSYWEQMNYKLSPIIAVTSFCIFAIVFIFSFYDNIRAYKDLDEYNSLIKECDKVVNDELIEIASKKEKTRSLFWNIAIFEDRYGNISHRYRGNYMSLKKLEDIKYKELKANGEQWEKDADEQMNIGRDENITKAIEFYSKSLSLFDNDRVRDKFEDVAEPFAYMRSIEIELRGEGNWNETLYAHKIKYLHVRLKYESFDPTITHNLQLKVKIYNNNILTYNESEYSSSYTFHKDVDVEPGDDPKYTPSYGWGRDSGGSYSKGSLRVEIWYGDQLLKTKRTTIY